MPPAEISEQYKAAMRPKIDALNKLREKIVRGPVPPAPHQTELLLVVLRVGGVLSLGAAGVGGRSLRRGSPGYG